MMNLEKDKWGSFKRYYFYNHRDFLSNLWFQYQGYTRKNIKERVNDIKKEDYAEVESQLKFYDIEDYTHDIITRCRNILYYPDILNIYLIIGFFSPDAFVIKYKDAYVICIGLERFHNFHTYPILLSHEFCHYVQNKINSEPSDDIFYRLISEGIAVYFSKIVYPQKRDHVHVFLTERRYMSIKENFKEILNIIKESKLKHEDLFRSHCNELPPRIGYFIGYRIITDFIKKTGIRDVEYLIKHRDDIFVDLKKP